jgi:hypothetical protein
VFGFQENGGGGRERAGGSGSAMEELAAGEIFFHGALLKKVDYQKLKVQTSAITKRSSGLATLPAASLLPRRPEKRRRAAALQSYFSG